MKRIKIFRAVAAAALLCALPAQANLIINGGFETGSTFSPNNVTGWTVGVDAPSITTDFYSGAQAAKIGPKDGAIFQTVPIVGGQTYYLDFWAKTDALVPSGTLTVTLDGGATAIYYPLTTTYAPYSATLTPGGSGNLTFSWADSGIRSAFIDDVSLVPEPTTFIAGGLLLLPFGVSTLRILRKSRTA